MLNWFLQQVFDEFNCGNGQDLQYKKLNWFLECQKFLIFRGTITKIPGYKFLRSGFLNAGTYCMRFKSCIPRNSQQISGAKW